MTENEIQRVINIIEKNEDIKKCNEYQSRINNSDYQCVYEALLFANRKYDELCLTDKDIIIANQIFRKANPIDKNIVNRALKSLECIQNILIAKALKDSIKN